MPPRNQIAILLAVIVSVACYVRADRSRYVSKIARAYHLISDRYVYDVRRRDLYEAAVQGMADALGDQNSAFYSRKRFRRLRQDLNQQFSGVGIYIELDEKLKKIRVIRPILGSPAATAGVRPGDLILKVDGEAIRDIDAAGKKIRGPQGTTVTLTVQHVGEEEPVDIEVRRDSISTPSVLGYSRKPQDKKWTYRLPDHPQVYYVNIDQFGRRTEQELREALDAAQEPIAALVLDLRYNPGGLLTSVTEICDMFIEEGDIVTICGRGGLDNPVARYTASEGLAIGRDVPIAVLINEHSASASEILAACLQDHRRAVVVGERSFGKGTVQEVLSLGDGNGLKLTTATYYRPSGRNIDRKSPRRDPDDEEDWGVRPTPGYEVRLSDEQKIKVRRLMYDLRLGREPEVKQGEPPTTDIQLQEAVDYLLGELARE